jgi:hypothetical protein
MVGGIVCDLEKTLDCVSLSTLLPKFKFYGLIGPTYTLLTFYLQGQIFKGVDR